MTRPCPGTVEPGYEDFVAAQADGRLVARRCVGCGSAQWPPRPLCGRCHSDVFEPLPIEPTGVVHTFIVVHRAFHPWFAERVPYGVAVVETDAGIRFMGLLDPALLAALAVGLRVTGEVTDLGGSPGILWRPAGKARS
jgi:uncharacterized OB-fold protein